jgi:hypothetical protein
VIDEKEFPENTTLKPLGRIYYPFGGFLDFVYYRLPERRKRS